MSDMRYDRLQDALRRGHGALGRHVLVELIGAAALRREIRHGELTALLPRVYARPWLFGDPDVCDVAAVRYAAPNALLSHESALRRFGFSPQPMPLVQHWADLEAAGRRSSARAAAEEREQRLARQSARRVSESAKLTPRQRAPIIAAVRNRAVLVSDLQAEVNASIRLPGRSRLSELLRLLAAGCESELEIWGYREVFTLSELAGGRWQHWLSTPHGWRRLDLAFVDARLAVELDGRALHAGSEQWERDIARDLDLAKLGWQTIRPSHRRLTTDVEGCRRDVLAVLARRRAVGYATLDR